MSGFLPPGVNLYQLQGSCADKGTTLNSIARFTQECVQYSAASVAWMKACPDGAKCQEEECTRITNHTWTRGTEPGCSGVVFSARK